MFVDQRRTMCCLTFHLALCVMQMQSQFLSYFLELPAGCTVYQGSNPRDCYNSIWREERCSPGGRRYPQSLSLVDFQGLQAINLRCLDIIFVCALISFNDYKLYNYTYSQVFEYRVLHIKCRLSTLIVFHFFVLHFFIQLSFF